MKKYFIRDEKWGYLCKEKGTFTSEDKKHTRNTMIFWSNFDEPMNRRLRYNKLGALLELWLIKLSNKSLNPEIVEAKE